MQAEVFAWHPPEEPREGGSRYLQGIARTADLQDGRAAYGHSGGTLGFTAMMYWLEDTGTTVVMLTNVGRMHAGISPAPPGLCYREVPLPAALRHVNASP